MSLTEVDKAVIWVLATAFLEQYLKHVRLGGPLYPGLFSIPLAQF